MGGFTHLVITGDRTRVGAGTGCNGNGPAGLPCSCRRPPVGFPRTAAGQTPCGRFHRLNFSRRVGRARKPGDRARESHGPSSPSFSRAGYFATIARATGRLASRRNRVDVWVQPPLGGAEVSCPGERPHSAESSFSPAACVVFHLKLRHHPPLLPRGAISEGQGVADPRQAPPSIAA